MGASLTYLDKPILKKTTSDGIGHNYKFAFSSMQGWRASMVS